MDYVNEIHVKGEFATEYYQNVFIEVEEPQAESSSGAVTVTVPDLKKIYMENKEDIMKSDDVGYIDEVLKNNIDKYVIEKSFEAELHQEGEQWKLSSTEQVDEFIAETVDDYLEAVLSDAEMPEVTINIDLEGM